MLLLANIITTVALHYITRYATKVLAMLSISNEVASIILLISIASCSLGFLYNYLITEVENGCCRDDAEEANIK